MFARWGRFVFRHPRLTLALSLLVLAVSILLFATGGPLHSPRSVNLESGHASQLLDSEIPKTSGAGSSFSLVVGSSRLRVEDPEFRAALDAALRPLSADRRVTAVITPFNAGTAVAPRLISRDHAHALVTVSLRDDSEQARRYYREIRDEVHSQSLDIAATGGLAIQQDFDAYLAKDLGRAEVLSLPLSLVLLLLVFGAVLAATLPVGVGVLSILGGFGGVALLGHFTDISQYASNIVTLIGLGVSIDYSLFLVTRFREEIGRGRDLEEAISRAMATAGRAVTFSGLTVAIGLSGMLFYQGSFLASMGAAGAIVVAVAVFYSLTFLPAVLVMLGPRINKWRLPVPRGRGEGKGLWHGLAMGVMRRPVLVLVPTVAFIVLAGTPFGHLRMANGDIEELPARAETRQATDILRRDFAGQDQTQMAVVAEFPGSPLTANRVGALYDYSRRLAAIPGVLRVESLVDADPRLNRAAYQSLLTGPRGSLPAQAQDALRRSVGAHVAVLSVLTTAAPESDAAREILRQVRAQRAVGDGQIEVTGQTAFDIDIINFVIQRTPLSVAYIVAVTCVVLFLLLGSVVLPIKAVIMNFLSLSASFGALVFIFQDGHLKDVLKFTPQSIDPSIPVLLFCIVFGLSMDYEVLLLSRMKEEYEATGDNRHAVAEGLEKSGRLISGAAAIMFGVFAAFGLADVVLIKSIGLGMAIAVAIDATVVRALIVPATMRLLGNFNWWAPGPLRRLYQRVGAADGGGA